MAERTGFEPATPGVTGRYSNQLNYRSVDMMNNRFDGNDPFVTSATIINGPSQARQLEA
jgi:hypothetical protein